MVGYETHEMVEDTLTPAAWPAVESSSEAAPSNAPIIEATTSCETPTVVPNLPPPPPPPKRPSVTMAPVPTPAINATEDTGSSETVTLPTVEKPLDAAIAHDSSRPLTTDDLQITSAPDHPDSTNDNATAASPSVGSESSSSSSSAAAGGEEPPRQAVRWSETEFAVDSSTVATTGPVYDVKASNVRIPPPISTTTTAAATTFDVPLSSLTSPLVSASHFLDRIRHLDEMFSTMTTGETGTGAAMSEEKRRSPISYYQQQQQSSSSSSSRHNSAHSSPLTPTYAGGGGRGGGYEASVSPQHSPYGGNSYGYPHVAEAAAAVSPSLRRSPSHLPNPRSGASPSLAAAHNLASMEREQAQNTQIHQTFQMYLSLVQRCSNTSARAKQVLDHLDQQMATVSSSYTSPPSATSYGRSGVSLRRPHSFATGNAGGSSSGSYGGGSSGGGGGTRSSPTHQVAPSYMQPTRSSRYGGDYQSGVHHRTTSVDTMYSSIGGGSLSRSSSYSNLRTGYGTSGGGGGGGGASVSSGSYMGHGGGGGSVSGLPPTVMGDDHAILVRTSSSSGMSVHSRPMSAASGSLSGSRSNSNQRGRNTTAVRSPIAKEILSNRPNPRVFSISPRKQR